jgi:putative ABC transport system permease protein
MFRNYLTLAWKVLLRRKFFTFISLFGISFTLVVLVLVTALVDNVAGQYPPETRQDRTVGLYFASMQGEHWRRNGFAGFALLDGVARNLPNVEQVGLASMPGGVFSYLNGQRVKSFLKRTDGAYWQILDFRFLEGGPFTSDDVRNGRMVAVINEATRQRFFGGAPALGRTLEADGQRFAVYDGQERRLQAGMGR